MAFYRIEIGRLSSKKLCGWLQKKKKWIFMVKLIFLPLGSSG